MRLRDGGAMHVFFSVGEPSGDLHASKLIEELRRFRPGMTCSGFGGPLMQRAGCELQYRLTDLAVMGLIAILPHLWRFISLIRDARRFFDERRPDAVVLVDYPGFNWWIARLAKRRGIPVFYYLPPQMWAWGGWRIHKMRRLVDLVLCCLPFEDEWYRRRGLAVRCVGHPFFDEVAERRLDGAFLESQAARPGRIVGILPGSRNFEVDMNFGVQLQVMHELHQRFPDARFLVAAYKDSQREKCERRYAASGFDLPIEFHVGKTSEIIQASDVCLMVSGSVSLELLSREKPAVVLYRSGPFHYYIGKLLITCRFYSLPNLVADRVIMPEFVILQDDPVPAQRMTAILAEWLARPGAREAVVADLAALKRRIAAPGATERAAAAILEHLQAAPTIARRPAA